MLLLAIIVYLLFGEAMGFPFSAKDGVVELTSKTLPNFINTHKPVFLMFYAPWCGHCKALHPEWEKFGKSSKGVFRVGALNADEHRDIAQQFGIQGFPTIKYWKMGDKKAKAKSQDYLGQRSFNALQSAALAEINTKSVNNLKTRKDLTSLIDKASSGKTVLLFSNKGKVPPMFGVLAASPALSNATFGFVSDTTKDIVTELGVTTFPKIMVVSTGESELTHSDYSGKVEYTEIAKFVHASLSGAASSTKSTEEKTEENENEKNDEKTENKERAKLSLPVHPVPFMKHSLEAYCSKHAQKIKGQTPLCVIALNDRDLTDIHNKYSREPVLFFNVEEIEDVQKLSNALNLEKMPEFHDVILVRAWKDKAKYAVVPGSEDLDFYLSRVMEGSLTMKKIDIFPSL